MGSAAPTNRTLVYLRVGASGKPGTVYCRELLTGLYNRFRFIACKANKNVNHTAIGYTDVIIYGVKLTIEDHLLLARWTVWPIIPLDKLRCSELVPENRTVL
jgi:hypothetical protein